MSDELEQEGRDLLNSVTGSNGDPIIVSMWGYHIEEIGGQRVLVASTREEVLAQLSTSRSPHAERLREQLIKDVPACGGKGPFNCFPYNGCTRCDAVYIGNGYYNCVCIG